MSSLWLEYPNSFEMCEKCTGTGKVRCSACGGAGGRYETRYDYDHENRSVFRTEWVSCNSCGGTGDETCVRCSGTGSIQRFSTTVFSPLPEVDTDESLGSYETIKEESKESKEFLEWHIRHIRQWILDYLQSSLVSSELKDDWYSRLTNLTDSNCEVELERLYREVRTAHARCIIDADVWSPSRALDLDRDLSRLEEDLGRLREILSRYISKYC